MFLMSHLLLYFITFLVPHATLFQHEIVFVTHVIY
jgi:hypothetical protein